MLAPTKKNRIEEKGRLRMKYNAGVLMRWQPRHVILTATKRPDTKGPAPEYFNFANNDAYVGTPTMQTLCSQLASHSNIVHQTCQASFHIFPDHKSDQFFQDDKMTAMSNGKG